MPPKKLTPYQFKEALHYDAPVPNFLANLNRQIDDNERARSKEDELPSTDEEDELIAEKEEERPQIVVLKEGKHMSEQEVEAYFNRKSENKKGETFLDDEEVENSSPSIDEKTGKILFRKPTKNKSSKNNNLAESSSSDTVIGSSTKKKSVKSDESIKSINEMIKGMKRKQQNTKDSSDKKVNPKKKSKPSHLSFNEEE
ncbi:11809_t:CDS:2 [Acaulospora colombiana]|uniref:11809_t:CDS:1 n=1 Tax=Acaulospora colombiana TaxID=27376 RepID=A0ACA9LD56_9GLOM|nr:11809_t:CDS:2 [Acaulospora colombiana]